MKTDSRVDVGFCESTIYFYLKSGKCYYQNDSHCIHVFPRNRTLDSCVAKTIQTTTGTTWTFSLKHANMENAGIVRSDLTCTYKPNSVRGNRLLKRTQLTLNLFFQSDLYTAKSFSYSFCWLTSICLFPHNSIIPGRMDWPYWEMKCKIKEKCIKEIQQRYIVCSYKKDNKCFKR